MYIGQLGRRNRDGGLSLRPRTNPNPPESRFRPTTLPRADSYPAYGGTLASTLLVLELCDCLFNGLGSRRTCRSRRTRSPHDGPAIRHEEGSRPGQHVENVARVDVLSCVIKNHPGLADARCARNYEVLGGQFSTCQLAGLLRESHLPGANGGSRWRSAQFGGATGLPCAAAASSSPEAGSPCNPRRAG